MTKLKYKVTGIPEKKDIKVSNEVAVSMQERLNAKLLATQPHSPSEPMAQPAQSDGFGRTI